LILDDIVAHRILDIAAIFWRPYLFIFEIVFIDSMLVDLILFGFIFVLIEGAFLANLLLILHGIEIVHSIQPSLILIGLFFGSIQHRGIEIEC